MKFIIASLLAGGTLVAAEMPTPSTGECMLVADATEYADATLIDPEPAVTDLTLVIRCTYDVPAPTSTNSAATKKLSDLFRIDFDRDQAEMLLDAAADLLDNGDVFLSNETP